MRFLFFSKTIWAEPPRLRHQLARLLGDAGHEVVFYEKPVYPWQSVGRQASGHDRIALRRYRQVLHHKLRLNDVLHELNAFVVERQLRRDCGDLGVSSEDVVVNFNYEDYFLRRLFPDNPLITLINDRYWSRALAGYEAPLVRVLARTCTASDLVLTVSEPLRSELAPICEAELFLPWADIPYQPPAPDQSRDTLLVWGYIDYRVDREYLGELADEMKGGADLKILVVGPIEAGLDVEGLRSHPAIEFRPASGLDSLPLSRVLAGLIPYREGLPTVDAISLPNKAMQLIARGLPLVIKGMTGFIQQPFVERLTGRVSDDVGLIRAVSDRFDEMQGGIREFVAENSADARLRQFLRVLSEIQSTRRSPREHA